MSDTDAVRTTEAGAAETGEPDPGDASARLAAAAAGSDVRVGLRATLALRRLAERLEALQVANARRQGWSWQEIADALEVSKQAVHQKHAARTAAPDNRRRRDA
jgi:DNA-binding NarL/FixJ family response regulator